jgi:hypothetical protein
VSETAVAKETAVAEALANGLEGEGHVLLPGLLGARDCRALARSYDDRALFRSRIVMARHGFGRGEYSYFAYPLPEIVAACGKPSIRHWPRWPTAGTKRSASRRPFRPRMLTT